MGQAVPPKMLPKLLFWKYVVHNKTMTHTTHKPGYMMRHAPAMPGVWLTNNHQTDQVHYVQAIQSQDHMGVDPLRTRDMTLMTLSSKSGKRRLGITVLG